MRTDGQHPLGCGGGDSLPSQRRSQWSAHTGALKSMDPCRASIASAVPNGKGPPGGRAKKENKLIAPLNWWHSDTVTQ